MSAPEIINPGAASGGIPVGGSGTPGKLAKFTGAGTSIGDSLLSESGTTITSAATAEAFGSPQTWTLPGNASGLTIKSSSGNSTFVLSTYSGGVGINVGSGGPGTLLDVSDGSGYAFAGSTYEGVRLLRATEALFSSSDGTRSFRAGLTGSTAVVGTSTAHDLLLQRNNVTALTLGASGADVVGTITSSGPIRATGTSATAPAFTGSDTDTGVYFPAANQVRISTAGSLAIAVDSSQNVGIGTTSPYASLSVRAAAAGGIGAWSLTGTSAGSPIGGSLFLGDDNYYNAGFYNKAPGLSAVYEASAGLASALAFYTYNGSRTERARIDAAGNVGIGTAGPSAPLTFGKSVYASPTSEDFYRIKLEDTGGTANDVGIGQPASGSLAFNWNSSGSLIFYQANAATPERMRIDSSGNVGIGTASPSSLGTNYTTLDIRGSAGGGIRAGTPSIMSYMYADTSGWNVATSTALPIIFYTNNIERARIDSTGNLILNTANTGATIQAAGSQQGLKLPATPGNADAQTLDCYQENPLATTAGNGWTPTLSAAAYWGGTQPNVTYARYVRMGSMVFCEVKLTMGAGTMTSTYGLTTIDSPFTTNTNASHAAVPVAAPGVSGVGFQSGTTVYLPTIGASSTFILTWSFFA